MFDFSFAVSIFPQLAVAALTTLFVTLVSFLLALIVGIPVLLLRRSRWQIVSQTTTAVVDFIRCTPILMQLYFVYFTMPEFGVRLSPLATGLIVFSMHYGCYMSEVYRAGLEAVPAGQWDACVALSLPRLETYRSIVLPQMIYPIIPAAGNYLVHLFKEMMFVSAEIGADRFRYLEPITLCGLLFLIMSIAAAGLIRTAEFFYGRHWRRAW
jgi:polar amino acid transport system permease protein